MAEKIESAIYIRHGIDASHSDAMPPVNINEAERSALAVKAHVDRNLGQVQVLEVTWPQPVAGNVGRGDF